MRRPFEQSVLPAKIASFVFALEALGHGATLELDRPDPDDAPEERVHPEPDLRLDLVRVAGVGRSHTSAEQDGIDVR